MDNGKLRHEVTALHARAGVPAAVRVLRVLDVVLWMRHHRQHQKRGSPRLRHRVAGVTNRRTSAFPRRASVPPRVGGFR
ncbi:MULTISPECIES: DUF6308 family protein [Micromonospora]|uniref:DUF6308 family protein n=1 Tax=Micromonospora TaxID=1873 RepID=UPI0034DE67C5